MFRAVGLNSKKVYTRKHSKEEVNQWLLVNFPSDKTDLSRKFKKTVAVNKLLPEPIAIKKG